MQHSKCSIRSLLVKQYPLYFLRNCFCYKNSLMIILCVTLTFIINKTVTKHLISFKKERFLYICNVQQSQFFVQENNNVILLYKHAKEFPQKYEQQKIINQNLVIEVNLEAHIAISLLTVNRPLVHYLWDTCSSLVWMY